jgi:hypothetical protein
MAKSLSVVVLLVLLAATACTQGATEGPINNIVPTNPPATATPTPAPTPTPSPTPTPAPQALTANGGGTTSASISLSFTAAGANQSFTVDENGYTGAFTVTNGCTSGPVVTLAPASGNGPHKQFTLTAQNAGICSIQFADTNSQSVNVSVTVTTTGGTLQGTGRGQ